MAFNKPISLNEQLDNTTMLFQIYMELDNTDKFCSETVQKGTFSPQTQAVIAQQLSAIAKKFEQMSAFPDQATYIKHVGNKLQSLQTKYSLGTDPANTMSNVPHSLFLQKTDAPQISSASRPQENASISRTIETQQPSKPLISIALNRISFLLRNNNEAQALEEFKNLPLEVKESVFGALWIVRGRPMPGNPIADHKFGEVSFFNQKQHCASTPEQKACAVELVKIRNSIEEMTSLLKEEKFEQAKALFLKLPSQMQNAIYGKHWEVCDKPKKGNPLYHWDFGKVSFLGTEQHCNVPCAKKAETLTAYLPQFIVSSNKAQELTSLKVTDWQSIDRQRIDGPTKLNQKIASIPTFSAEIIKCFLGEGAKIEIRDLGPNPKLKDLAAAYIENYQFLKPFLLQLENKILFSGETLENS